MGEDPRELVQGACRLRLGFVESRHRFMGAEISPARQVRFVSILFLYLDY
jgi:hypothetical protein